MNKYEEGFNKIVKNNRGFNDVYCKEELILIKELVERATPKKVTEYELCPTCYRNPLEKYKFCDCCGQALEWDNDNN